MFRFPVAGAARLNRLELCGMCEATPGTGGSDAAGSGTISARGSWRRTLGLIGNPGIVIGAGEGGVQTPLLSATAAVESLAVSMQRLLTSAETDYGLPIEAQCRRRLLRALMFVPQRTQPVPASPFASRRVPHDSLAATRTLESGTPGAQQRRYRLRVINLASASTAPRRFSERGSCNALVRWSKAGNRPAPAAALVRAQPLATSFFFVPRLPTATF